MNIARVRFKKGDRVFMTEKALNAGLNGRRDRRTGVVVGYGLSHDTVRIVPDGTKTVGTYHESFWAISEPDPEPKP